MLAQLDSTWVQPTFDYHAWTSFFEQYLQIYTRMGSTTAAPDDVQTSWIHSTFDAYMETPGSSFARCIADTACGPEPGTADRAWGGVTHRFAQLHGPGAARRFLLALPQVRAVNGPPQSLQDKADLHFEALSQASGTDLGCYADAWRWSISPALRARMAALPAEPRCVDLDGDGASPLLGDCDDDDPAVGPAAKEILNGRDDDCNGVVDNGLIVDVDGDGSRACGTCGASAAPNCDCNDTNNAVRPGRAETCNNVDDDCDAATDEDFDVGAECTIGQGRCLSTGRAREAIHKHFGSVVAVSCCVYRGSAGGRRDEVWVGLVPANAQLP